MGPRLLYTTLDWSIEAFLEARPLTIWEMRNPLIMKLIANKLYEFNQSKILGNAVSLTYPFNRENVGLDKAINTWAKDCKERFPSMRGKLL